MRNQAANAVVLFQYEGAIEICLISDERIYITTDDSA